MFRWTNLVGALLLVLTVWTGTSAHAAERFDCIPVTEQSESSASDRGQVPADPDQGDAHQHTGCTGHHAATPGYSGEIALSIRAAKLIGPRHDTGRPSREPESQLRPPIA